MKVVFLRDVPGLGKVNEVKEVQDGYARNYLIPKGVVQIATPQIISKLANESRQKEEKKKREQERSIKLKSELDKRTFSIQMKIGEKNQAYASVHEKDIVEKIKSKMDIDIEKNMVILPQRLKEPGEYVIEIKLGGGIIARPKIKLESN